MALNKVMLIGNVGKDPEIRSANGIPVASFPLATTEVFSSKSGQRQEHTEWHNIVVWRGTAEVVEKYVKKGTPLYIEGRIRTRWRKALYYRDSVRLVEVAWPQRFIYCCSRSTGLCRTKGCRWFSGASCRR